VRDGLIEDDRRIEAPRTAYVPGADVLAAAP
jgi:hypothetical protein